MKLGLRATGGLWNGHGDIHLAPLLPGKLHGGNPKVAEMRRIARNGGEGTVEKFTITGAS